MRLSTLALILPIQAAAAAVAGASSKKFGECLDNDLNRTVDSWKNEVNASPECTEPFADGITSLIRKAKKKHLDRYRAEEFEKTIRAKAAHFKHCAKKELDHRYAAEDSGTTDKYVDIAIELVYACDRST